MSCPDSIRFFTKFAPIVYKALIRSLRVQINRVIIAKDSFCSDWLQYGIVGLMKIEYARVSTDEQDLTVQIEDLKCAGCEKIFSDKASGTKIERPDLKQALDYMRECDLLVVWRLDRLEVR